LSSAARRVERVGGLELEAARFDDVPRPGVEASTCALSGTPMLPPTSTRSPEASSIRPTSVVVVDLPLVPVMAMTLPASHREASSSSPMTGTPAARAAASGASSGGTPGLVTMRSAPVKRAAPWPLRSSVAEGAQMVFAGNRRCAIGQRD
jgi:hypothetical protein